MKSSAQLSKLTTLPPATLDRLQAQIRAKRNEGYYPPLVEWLEENFRIEDTGQPIQLMPHQKAVLNYAFTRLPNGRLPFTTVMYSSVKKSGKTTIAGGIGRWAAETWQRFGEVLCVGNDADQAQGRGFKAMADSIQMEPGYQLNKKLLPGRWQTGMKKLTCLTTGTVVKAIATDYTGEAGANPIMSIWTELWGFIHTGDLRFWAEMAPSPTRPDSIRLIETYAGYEGESELLYGLYESVVLNGRQLTAGELGDLSAFEEAPNPDSLVPCYVNEAAGMFAYWDHGVVARRMPWQRGERGEQYYKSEAATQTPSQMSRLHEDEWVSAESAYIPIEWWDRLVKPLPLAPGDQTPMVISLDAAVSGDCFGLVMVSRDPDRVNEAEPGIAVRAVRKWTPPPGGTIDYSQPEAAVRELCANFNVVEVAYDPYQLHDMATRLMREGVVWCRSFGQQQERLVADSDLYKIIVQARMRHDGNPDLREHLTNANAKIAKGEDTKMRIVKKSESRKIDLAVCLSMASYECLRLLI